MTSYWEPYDFLHNKIFCYAIFQGTRQKSARPCCTLSAGPLAHRTRGGASAPLDFYVFKCPLKNNPLDDAMASCPPPPAKKNPADGPAWVQFSGLTLGRWQKKGGGRGGGVVCTCMDIRSVNIFCFLKTCILQLGMDLKVRQNCHRI